MTESIAAFAAVWLPTYLLHSTFFIGGAFVVAKLARLGGPAAERVWRVALLGGVVTATGATIAQPPPGAELARIEIRAERSKGQLWVEADAEQFAIHQGAAAPFKLNLPLETEHPVPAERLPTWLMLWVVGGLIGVAYVAVSVAGERRLVARAGAVGPRALAAMAHLPEGSDVTVRMSDEVASPCAVAGGTLILPGRCEEEMPGDELRAVVSHEWAHLRRGDPFWTRVFALLRAVLWLQPLNFLATRGAAHAAEEICDRFAARRVGALPLAQAIERVARWSLEGRRPAPGVAMVWGSTTDRVRTLLAGDQRTLRGARWGWGAALAVALPALFIPAITTERDDATALFVERRVITMRADTVLSPGRHRVIMARFESGDRPGD